MTTIRHNSRMVGKQKARVQFGPPGDCLCNLETQGESMQETSRNLAARLAGFKTFSARDSRNDDS